MTAAFGWTGRVSRHVPPLKPMLCPRVTLWSQSFRHKQEVRYSYRCKRNWSLRSLGCLPLKHQYQGIIMAKLSHESDIGHSLRLPNSRPDQDFGVGRHEFVCKTASQSPIMDLKLEDAGEDNVGSGEMKADIDSSRGDHVVYKRRFKKMKAVEKVLTVIETSHEMCREPDVVACTKISQDQSMEASAGSAGKAGHVQKQIDPCEHIESDMAARYRQKKVTTGTVTDSVSGRRRKKAVACDMNSQNPILEATAGTACKAGQGRKKKVLETIDECQNTEEDMARRSRKKKVMTGTSADKASGIYSRTISAEACQTVKLLDSLTEKAEANLASECLEAHLTEEEQSMEMLHKDKPWLALAHKKLQADWIVYDPLTLRSLEHRGSMLKFLSWNVNGLRALLRGKGEGIPGSSISRLAEKEDFDVLCLQETKLQEKDVNAIKETLLPTYGNSLWSCSTAKLGYSGTAVISRIKPLSISYGLGISKHDSEGRVITVEFKDFFLVTCYVPNSGQKLERLAYRTQDWDLSLGNFLKDLEKKKPVILTGDLNCAHQEIDIYNPDGNRRSAGFTDEERQSFETNFLNNGFYDTFRRQHPNVVGYTYWGYRSASRPKNHGWRLDYYLASDALVDMVQDSYILPEVDGSDHCPVGLILKV